MLVIMITVDLEPQIETATSEMSPNGPMLTVLTVLFTILSSGGTKENYMLGSPCKYRSLNYN